MTDADFICLENEIHVIPNFNKGFGITVTRFVQLAGIKKNYHLTLNQLTKIKHARTKSGQNNTHQNKTTPF